MPQSGTVALALERPTPSRDSGTPRQTLLVRATIELAIAAVVFAVYRAGRLITNDSVTAARQNAQRVIDVQNWFGGAIELAVQRRVLDLPGVIDVLNHFYVFVHFPATVLFLVWAFARHRDRYPAIRNWFVGVTMSAMAIHVVFPLAPPRMLDGYVDTLREFGPNIYTEDPSRSVANQFAAMPSLHFGWALMVAVGIIVVTNGRYRWWWLAHPAVTLLAIVATGNHYLLDAAVAGALAALVGLAVLRRRDRSHEPDAAPSVRFLGPTDPPVCTARRSRRLPAVHRPSTVLSPLSGTAQITSREDDHSSISP